MADLRIVGTVYIIIGCTFLKGYGLTSPPTQTNNCPSETVRGYTWNDTASGVTISQRCQSPYNRGQTFRTCRDGKWTESEYSTCRTVKVADRDTIYLIQYVCCGTTILTVLLTLFILVFACRKTGAETTILEMSFGLAIIASNTAFISGVNNTADELMCKITAVCLHYLPTVTVFHLFAIMFHLATLKFQTSPYSYCCLFFWSWGAPAIIVGLYGYFTLLEEYGNSENCWVVFSTRLFWVYYGTLMAICGLIFVGILGVIYRLKLPGRGPKPGSVIGAVPVFIVFITTIMTWVTGVISVNEYKDGLYITQIIFGILNFIQGLAYLVVFGVMGSRARKEKAFRKVETRLSRLSLPTVTTYTGYKDDHVRDWSYNHHLYNTQQQQVTDFYSTDEEVQQRYLQARRSENHRDETQMDNYLDSREDRSSFQMNKTPEKQDKTVVIVHKEVVGVPDRFQSVDQIEHISNSKTDKSHRVQTVHQRMVNVAPVIPQTQMQHDPANSLTLEFHDSTDDDIINDNSQILVENSQAVYQRRSHTHSKDNENSINASGGYNAASSPVTQRSRSIIDPPAPSRISVTEIETFTIDVPEEKVTQNESHEFILQDEGDVVMEHRNGNRGANYHYPTTEHEDNDKTSPDDHPKENPGVSFPSHVEPATTAYDTPTGSMIVYDEEDGNTLQHITNGIAMDNGYAADDDSSYTNAISSQQPAPLNDDTENNPLNSHSQMPQETQATDKPSLRNKLNTRNYPDDDAKPKSKFGVSSSFLDRLRKKLRPVSKTPILRNSPPDLVVHQEPNPEPEPNYENNPQNYDPLPNFAIQAKNLQDEGSSRRQWQSTGGDLVPPSNYNPEAPGENDRPPTPPSPFIGPPPSTPSPPVSPPIPQSSPFGKRVSFANHDVEISSHL